MSVVQDWESQVYTKVAKVGCLNLIEDGRQNIGMQKQYGNFIIMLSCFKILFFLESMFIAYTLYISGTCI